jgi:acyl carrier protein
MRESIKSNIFEILSGFIPENIKLSENSRLVEDLALDSIDVVDIIVQVEDFFELRINDEDVNGLKSVNCIVDYIEKRKNGEG